ncbi:dienelactone hydrolase [Parahaliea maris]|uniref:Dienelactone hydrolase n=1 Tax=Parahaliea maris TaxID=2716870 RepID=A0A5C9A649_9GAMM|nr:dienelactone hydrolase [Parahaliea maris]TXS96413.1 dienelactone hydrolase [Parahaliea maris]
MRNWRVRALYRAVAVPGQPGPFDRATLKIYYPARYGDSLEERNSGCVPPDPAFAPCPVVIFLPGINLGPEAYAWLARALAAQGFVCVLPSMVAEEMPGYTSLTPGLDVQALLPEHYGSRPSATTLAPIREMLKALNSSGQLAGSLDLQRLVLGGHSAGGSVALLNARRDWLPGLQATFCYGAHAGAASQLGYPPAAQFPLPAEVPTLMLGGDRDGCIANSLHRYGLEDGAFGPTAMVQRSFEDALERHGDDSYLGILTGANHFSLAWPEDSTTGRPFIDLAATRPGTHLRRQLLCAISRFLRGSVLGDSRAVAALERQLGSRHNWQVYARR